MLKASQGLLAHALDAPKVRCGAERTVCGARFDQAAGETWANAREQLELLSGGPIRVDTATVAQGVGLGFVRSGLSLLSLRRGRLLGFWCRVRALATRQRNGSQQGHEGHQRTPAFGT